MAERLPKVFLDVKYQTLQVVFAAAMYATCGCAMAQSTEYRLGDERAWTVAHAPEPGTDEWTIAEARRFLAQDDPGAAKGLLDPWLEANERTNHPLRSEALLLRGDARLALDEEYNALYDYEEIIKKHRPSPQFEKAVERELQIALMYAGGLRIRILGIRFSDASDIAIELLIRVQERMPRSSLAERASIELADFYYNRRELKLAYEAYSLYLENFPSGPNAVKAQQRRIQSDVARFKGPRYNASPLINARTQISSFVKRHPAEAEASGMDEALIARLDESMAAQLLDTSEWYLRLGDEPSARMTLRRLLRDFPSTLSSQNAERIMNERGWDPYPPAAELPASSESPSEDSVDGTAPSGENPAPEETP